MHMYVLLIINRKKLNVKKLISGLASAMLRLYVMQNPLRKTEDAYIVNLTTGEITYFYKGTGDFPEEQANYGNIDDHFDDLLSQLREQFPDYLK